ncbi:hypothetical protein BS50DRAFT_567722 [Corynespora cassiicola Philippines]|uniref:Uncharacterized protein n=1 Tax=Corynespora cassiicola Philippines TaxID=1448308 RepID=A0A2T2PBE0_CORCC|nr:hypothetical protein BS50DRAFT_567722 [Corynespora cassiicola Philippines]
MEQCGLYSVYPWYKASSRLGYYMLLMPIYPGYPGTYHTITLATNFARRLPF